MRCTLTETGPIAPTEVWQRYVDLDAWPRWAPLITAVEAEPRTLVAGLTGTVVGPGGLRVRFVVDEVEPPARTWSWRARLGVLRLALHHTVLDGPSGARRRRWSWSDRRPWSSATCCRPGWHCGRWCVSSYEQAERVTARVEQHPDVVLWLDVGQHRTAGDGPPVAAARSCTQMSRCCVAFWPAGSEGQVGRRN